MDFSVFGNMLSSLYTDEFEFYTKAKVTNADGTIGSKMSTEPVQSEIPCRISYETEDSPSNFTEEANPVRLRFKIFCSNDVPISKGDKIVAYKKDGQGNILKTYSGTANLPLVYETHIEIAVDKVGEA